MIICVLDELLVVDILGEIDELAETLKLDDIESVLDMLLVFVILDVVDIDAVELSIELVGRLDIVIVGVELIEILDDIEDFIVAVFDNVFVDVIEFVAIDEIEGIFVLDNNGVCVLEIVRLGFEVGVGNLVELVDS